MNIYMFQTEVSYSIAVGGSGRYYVVLQYYSDVAMRMQTLDVEVVSSDRGTVRLTNCPYRCVFGEIYLPLLS